MANSRDLNLDEISFDVNVDDYNQLVSKVDELRINKSSPTSVAQHACLFQPSPSSATKETSKTGIINDAKHVIQLLIQKAKLATKDAHEISINASETGLSNQHFHAACELVDAVMFKVDGIFNKHNIANKIESYAFHAANFFKISAFNASQYKSKHAATPIRELPFDECLTYLDHFPEVILLSKPWDILKDSEFAYKKLLLKETVSYIYGYLCAIEKCCQELDKTFKLDCKIQNDTIFVNKKSLDLARTLCIGDNSHTLQPRMT